MTSRSSSTTPAGNRPPARRPGGRTRAVSDRILAAAARVLSESGYSALSFQDVAARAGVSRSTLYRRWPGCAELALDAIATSIRESIVLPDTGTLAEDLVATLTMIGGFMTRPLGAAVLAAVSDVARSPESSIPRARLWKRGYEVFAPMFQRARERGEIPPDVDVEAVLAMAAGAVYFRVIVMAGEIDDAWVRRIVALLFPLIDGKARPGTCVS